MKIDSMTQVQVQVNIFQKNFHEHILLNIDIINGICFSE